MATPLSTPNDPATAHPPPEFAAAPPLPTRPPEPSPPPTPPAAWPPSAGTEQPSSAPPPAQPYWPPAASPQERTPGIWPVLLVTLLFGVFGLIPTVIFHQQVRAKGRSPSKYWIAFGCVMAVWVAVVVGASIAASSSSSSSAKIMSPSELDTQLTTNSDWKTLDGTPATATDATCVEQNVRTNGTGAYECLVTFDDGTQQTFTVTVGSDGSWVTSSG